MKSMTKVVKRLSREKGCFRDRDGNNWNTEYAKVVWETVSPIILRKYGPKTGKLIGAGKPFTILWVRQKHLGVIIKFLYESSTPK